jgi:cytochrome d ubiquinol oxidase subunit II
VIETIWYFLVAFTLVGYVVLDGFDLGAGILHLFVARTPEERDQLLRTLGPVWDGNEVWLITAGATLFFAFPKLYALGFSGFYLPLTIVLWLLVFRALGIELRHHSRDPLWHDFWDVAFALASFLLALCFGVALGNVVRGMTFNAEGRFFAPLWTHFRVAEPTGLLDVYTVMVGLLVVSALALHGALWLALRAVGGVEARALRLVKPLTALTFAFTAAATAMTLDVQPRVLANLYAWPVGFILPALALSGLIAVVIASSRGQSTLAFFGSCAFLTGMLASAAFGIYPYVLPAHEPGRGLTVSEAAADPYALGVALVWWLPGMTLAIGYFVVLYRHISTRVPLGDEEH